VRPHACQIIPKAAPGLMTVRRRHYTNSHQGREGQTHGENALAAGHPSHLKRTVTPTRRPNAELRRREHLTEAEVERLMEAEKGNRWGHRDRHHGTRRLPARPTGFRAGRPSLWDQVDFGTSTLHVRRVKTGTNSRPRRGHHARSRFTAFLPPKILYQALAAIAAGLPQGRSKPQES
jgi:integrase